MGRAPRGRGPRRLPQGGLPWFRRGDGGYERVPRGGPGSDGARGVVWPYLLRSISDVPRLEDAEGSDVDSVYGYPGPLAWGCKPGDGFTRGAVDAIVAVWRSQGALGAFTRFHPLLGNERWGADVPAVGPNTGPSVLELGETVAIDLRQDNDAAVGA